MSYQKNSRRADINVSAAGTIQLVAPGQLGAGFGSVHVWQVLLNGGGANVITFPSGGATSTPIVFNAAGASAVLQNTEEPWFKGLPGQGMSITTTTASTVTGSIWYTLA